jgi:hypothetical protein
VVIATKLIIIQNIYFILLKQYFSSFKIKKIFIIIINYKKYKIKNYKKYKIIKKSKKKYKIIKYNIKNNIY